MKRKITFLSAALMLLAFLAVPLGMWGQTTVSYGWETSDDATKWTITDAIVATSGQGNTGTYAGKINTNHTYVQFNEKVYVTSFSFAFKRTSNNNNYYVYIETSTDGSTWTAIETYAMSSFSNGTYSTKTHTFDGTTEYYVRFHCYNTTAVRYVDDVSITYASGAATVATPTFSLASGPYIGAQSVTISCETENSTIYYTTDGSIPDNTSTQYNGDITVSETTTIKAIAYVDNDASSVASATYTIVNLEHAGTEADPYSVADAHTAIDANVGTAGVYATGIVSAIPTAYNSTYGNITFNMVDEEGDEVFLQAYRCAGDEAANVAIGDVAVVYGNLTKYGSTYEFSQGCEVVSLEHPAVVVEAPTFDPEAGFYDEAQTVTISTATEGASIYYTLDGTDPDTESEQYEAPFTVSETTTIKAIAVDGNNIISSIASATYVFEGNISNISEINTPYYVRGTVVATNSRGFIIGDGTGYVYTYLNATPTQAVGDMVTVSGTTGTYGQIIQFTNAATVSEATTSNYDGTPEVTVITEVPDYTQGYHLSDYLQFEGSLEKTNNNYLITLGEAQIQISYPTSDQGTALTALDGKQVLVKGYFSGINSSNKFSVMLESVEEIVSTEPSITVTPDNVNVNADEHDGTLTLAYENLVITEMNDFGVQYYNADGQEAEDPEWLEVLVAEQDPTIGEGYVVSYTIDANDGDARTAYFKVFAITGAEFVYSNLVTVNQAEYIPDYATLPFAFDGGRAAIDTTAGLTQDGLGSDYNSSPKLKFDSADDWLILHFLEEPDTLTFDIKGNSFSGGTFKVQASEDGETYEDLREYTNLGNLQHDTLFLSNNVRYIKWVYTEKVSGNVALGNIKVTKYTAPAIITVETTTINADAEGVAGVLNVTYENITTVAAEIAWYEATGAPLQNGYDWVDAEIDANNNVYYVIDANNGEARTAYMKVWAYDDGLNEVYSDLVTIIQAEYVAPVQPILTVEPDITNLDTPNSAEGQLTITATDINLDDIIGESFVFYTLEGEDYVLTNEEPDWLEMVVSYDIDVINYNVQANTGDARTAYFKLKLESNNQDYYYSNIVTISQAAFEVPTSGTGTITFGNNGTKINAASVTGVDNLNNEWTITTEGTTSFTQAANYSQVGSSNKPATSITFTMTLPQEANITDFEAKFGGFSNTAGNITLKVGETTVGSGLLDATNDVTVTNTTQVTGTTLTVTVTNIAKGVKCYYISYTYEIGEPQPSIILNTYSVEATADETEGNLTITLDNIVITETGGGMFDYIICDAEGVALSDPSSVEAWLALDFPYENDAFSVYYVVSENTTTTARTAYFKVYGLGDDGTTEAYSNTVTITQAGAAPTPVDWVLTNLADLTEGDVFVIVGTRYDDNYAGNYAMPNDNDNSAPGAVAITINGEALAEEPAANLQWNISRTGNSYTFYPNGDTENWLYCINANNGVKVGNGDNNSFIIQDGYLYNVGSERYIGIYNSQDWRCYTNNTGNIANQSFAFYKKVVPTETYNLTINGYGQSEGGYRLIASPVYVKPETTGMTEGNFDLYYFDQSEVGFEWRNFEEEEGQFNLVPGKGYLYAHDTDVELTFTGIPYSGDGTITLVKDDNAVWAGWNLVGNPFGTTAYLDRDFYVMNEAGTEILTDACTGAVEAMQAVFVIAGENGETLTFTNQTPEPTANVTLNLSQNRGAVIDRTIVRFGEGRQLPKFQLNAESTKLYIPQGNNDYAVVRSAASGEMPVNFKAERNGIYTLSVNAENVEASYLHLIDNMSGADIDLLVTPSYSFEAKTTDYTSRFRLVFNITSVEENTTSTESFAFFNGNEWVISNTGEATLQVVDMLGRIISSETVNGNTTITTNNLSNGVYVMRLTNGNDVKTQKIVVR